MDGCDPIRPTAPQHVQFPIMLPGQLLQEGAQGMQARGVGSNGPAMRRSAHVASSFAAVGLNPSFSPWRTMLRLLTAPLALVGHGWNWAIIGKFTRVTGCFAIAAATLTHSPIAASPPGQHA